MKFENKLIIITGGARDIGAAITKKFASEGANVVVNYYSSEAEAKALEQDIAQYAGGSLFIKGDLTNPAEVTKLISSAVAKFGDSIHTLVNVTGGLVARKTIEEMDLDFFNKVMSLNFTTTFLAAKAVLPYMSKNSSIVNLASQAGRDGGGPGASIYASSKGAVITFTRALAKELGPKGIRANSLCPGMISTKFHDDFTKDQVRTNVANMTPLKREGLSKEVADATIYLASAEASFITGTNIDINGGLYFS